MMSSFLARGAAWLGQMAQCHLSEPVVYGRGAEEVGISAVPGRSGSPASNQQGITIPEAAMDWIIPQAALVLGGTRTLPQPADTIERTLGEMRYTYRVTPLAEGEDCYRSDPFGVQLRVHTVLVATEEA